MSVFRCNEDVWNDTALVCWGGGHYFLVALTSVSILLLAVLSLICVACFIDRRPESPSLLAQAHGRVAVLLLSLKAIVAPMMVMHDRVDEWVLITALGVIGVMWMGAFWYYLPYYSARMNSVQGAMAMCFIWSTVCLIAAMLLDEPDHAGTYQIDATAYLSLFHLSVAGGMVAWTRWSALRTSDAMPWPHEPMRLYT